MKQKRNKLNNKKTKLTMKDLIIIIAFLEEILQFTKIIVEL